MKLQVFYKKDDRIARVTPLALPAPAGFVKVGEIDHPDPVYPDSLVLYHALRDLFYKRSASDPTQPAMFPNNITDMDKITIELDLTS